MPRVCVLLAEGFEEIEAVTIIDVLRRAEVEVVTLSVQGALDVKGSHGISVRADRMLREAARESWDMVVLPGGIPGSNHLRDSPEVQDLLKRQHRAGGRIGAICAAPIALGAAGLLEGKRATSYPGFEKELRGATCLAEPVVRDGTIVTSRGVGTALAFALELVAELSSRQVADELEKRMLVSA
jgi:4-methyl-5(b-hydroxyethyl)-thiazole monophosphate biosynthesis